MSDEIKGPVTCPACGSEAKFVEPENNWIRFGCSSGASYEKPDELLTDGSQCLRNRLAASLNSRAALQAELEGLRERVRACVAVCEEIEAGNLVYGAVCRVVRTKLEAALAGGKEGE